MGGTTTMMAVELYGVVIGFVKSRLKECSWDYVVVYGSLPSSCMWYGR
jgi:hypothetical protein